MKFHETKVSNVPSMVYLPDHCHLGLQEGYGMWKALSIKPKLQNKVNLQHCGKGIYLKPTKVFSSHAPQILSVDMLELINTIHCLNTLNPTYR